MKQNTHTTTVALIALIGCLNGSALAADYYVSPTGDDGNPGTLKKPFRTVVAARDRVRERIAEGLNEDIRVHLRAGTYILADTVLFDGRDSGTAAHAVTWQAYEDEKVVISGGRRLSGKWKRHDGNIWRLSLPDVKSGKLWFRQLFMEQDDQITRATRARWPNEGEMARTIGADNKALVYRMKQQLPVDSLKPSDRAEVQVFVSWVSARARVTSASGQEFRTETMPGNPHHHTRTKHNQGLFFEHAYGFIDLPGEWWLDRDNGALFLMMNEGADPNALAFCTGRIETLLRIAGTVDKPVFNLNFRKLRFHYSSWALPEIGYGDMWTGNYGTMQKGINWVRHVPLAIECEYIRDCDFEMCEVAHMGGSGIGFGRGARGSRVVGCHVHDISAIGINLGWRTKASPTGDGWVHYDRVLKTDLVKAWGGEAHVPGDNGATDNKVHHCGQVYQGCSGIFLAFNRNFDISRNYVYGLPYGCIIHQHYAGERERCISSYNHVFETMLLLGDGGAIYSSVTDTGAHVHHNYVHDVKRRPGAFAKNSGIYLDDFGKNCLAEHNAFHSVTHDEFQLRSAGHLIRNNRGVKTIGFSGGARPGNVTIVDREAQSVELTEDERLEMARIVGPREPYRSWLEIPEPTPQPVPGQGDDLLIADFEGKDYGDWKVEGEAFGKAPAKGTLGGQQRVSGFMGKGLVNTFIRRDEPTGTLTSPPFTIERDTISFLIGGGHHPGKTCIDLLIDPSSSGDFDATRAEVVRTATGPASRHGGSEFLDWENWDVGPYKGKQAVIRIVDAHSGRWGHVNVDQIVQRDTPMKKKR